MTSPSTSSRSYKKVCSSLLHGPARQRGPSRGGHQNIRTSSKSHGSNFGEEKGSQKDSDYPKRPLFTTTFTRKTTYADIGKGRLLRRYFEQAPLKKSSGMDTGPGPKMQSKAAQKVSREYQSGPEMEANEEVEVSYQHSKLQTDLSREQTSRRRSFSATFSSHNLQKRTSAIYNEHAHQANRYHSHPPLSKRCGTPFTECYQVRPQ
jgi:hypothetical protein